MILTSNKDFIVSHLNPFHPLKAVSRLSRPVSMKAHAQSQDRPCGICGAKSGAGTGFSPSISVFSYQYHSISVQYSFIHLSIHSSFTDAILSQLVSASLCNMLEELYPCNLFIRVCPWGLPMRTV
jgi:hypothetical protein